VGPQRILLSAEVIDVSHTRSRLLRVESCIDHHARRSTVRAQQPIPRPTNPDHLDPARSYPHTSFRQDTIPPVFVLPVHGTVPGAAAGRRKDRALVGGAGESGGSDAVLYAFRTSGEYG
jgi:hypothetical protein